MNVKTPKKNFNFIVCKLSKKLKLLFHRSLAIYIISLSMTMMIEYNQNLAINY